MKISDKIEPIIAHGALGGLAVVLLVVYVNWEPSADFPSSWKAGVYDAALAYFHRPGAGTYLGKGILLLTIFYCLRKIFLTIKS